MVAFTMEDYSKYKKEYSNKLKREDIKRKDDKNKKNTHQYHDKLIRKLLDNKTEFVKFMKQFLGYDIKESETEKYNRKFITDLGFKVRESDIIYKIKDKEIFVLIEHQSTVNYKMPERITEYCVLIINSRSDYKKKQTKAPAILPVVLNTSTKKWDASLTIVQEKEEYYGFPELEFPKYNLVDVNTYKDEELLRNRTGLSLAMLFEKQKNKENLEKIFKIIIKRGTNEYEKRCLLLMLEYSDKIKKLFKNELEEYKNKIKRGKGDNMTNFENLYLQLLDEKFNNGIKQGMSQGMSQGIKQGISEGKSQGIAQVVKEMIKEKVKDEQIMKYTHISKKQLEKIKLQVG